MLIERQSIEYQILDECKCGPEEFFVLVSSVEDGDIESFCQALVNLVADGYLRCDRGNLEDIRLSIEDLHIYVEARRKAGEDLEQYPVACEEFRFTTTDRGIDALLPEDRPIQV